MEWLTEAEAAQLKAKTAESKAAQSAAADKAKLHAEEVKRLEKQQSKNQELLALQTQCQYMSNEEKKWWFDQGVDPTKEIVEYGRYQQYKWDQLEPDTKVWDQNQHLDVHV